MDAFLIKRNDTLPALEAVLSDENGPVDLSGATVFFSMAKAQASDDCGCDTSSETGAVKFKKSAVVVGSQALGSPTRGKVRYEWSGDDTDTAGFFSGEFEVLFGVSGRWSFPTVGTFPISVTEDLG